VPAPGIEDLRRQLREKFPAAHGVHPRTSPRRNTGTPFHVDSFPYGAISEIIPAGPGAGLSLVIAALMGDSGENSPLPELALIDGADGFDPSSHTVAACSRLLWVRCTSAPEMLKAADLVVRDGNLPFVLLDASGLPRQELTAIPASSWWRLGQLTRRTGGRLVVLSPFPFVPGTGLLLTLSADLSLHDFDVPRRELLEKMTTDPGSLRQAT
jgi:hypothetical protein